MAHLTVGSKFYFTWSLGYFFSAGRFCCDNFTETPKTDCFTA